MTAAGFPQIDRDELERFVAALFVHADPNTFVSMRAFYDHRDGFALYGEWQTVRVTGTDDDIVDAAEGLSTLAALDAEAIVFASPIATFAVRDKADEESVANGLVITAELDSNPERGQRLLEDILGPATVVLQSGGLWSDPATGEVIPKLHLHWRLSVPTRRKIEHDFLKEANRLVTTIAGGDPSAVPLVHPLRWAGSWHRKVEPRLSRIVEYRPEIEIACGDALAKLRAAAKTKGNGHDHDPLPPFGGTVRADLVDIAAAIAVIPNDDRDPGSWNQWNTTGLRLYAATGGSAGGYALFLDWSASSTKKFDEANTRERWRHYASSPPDRTGAGALFNLAREHYPDFVRPSEFRLRAQQAASLRDFEARQPRSETREETPWHQPIAEEAWPEMAAEAFHGLAGDIVDAINPNCEADPIAVLAQILALVGCAVGRGVYFQVGDTRHHPNIFTVICGTTAKGRKGTSYDPVESLMRQAAAAFIDNCVKSGLSSGEGIVHTVHDQITSREKVPQGGKGKPPVYATVVKFENVADKRLFLIEQEFAAARAAMQRPGNTLSPVLRLAWDGRKLGTVAKTNPETATGAHISLVGHITIDELRSRVDQVLFANGFLNRFLLILARRSKELPFPLQIDGAIAVNLAARLNALLTNSIALHRRFTFDDQARQLWAATYHTLSAEYPGLYGFLIARAEPQVLRLSMIYAALDQTHHISHAHLRAALDFWEYCSASARYIFGDALGDPVADTILQALRRIAPDAMTRIEISQMFAGNRTSEQISKALTLLAKHGKAHTHRIPASGKGRPPEAWKAC